MLFGILGIDFGCGGTSLCSSLLLLGEFGLAFLDLADGLLSLGVSFFGGLATLSSNFLAVETLNVSDDSPCPAFLSLGSLISLELLVKPSPDDCPTDDLTLDLSVVEATGFLGREYDESSVLGDDAHSLARVYLLL